MVKVKMTTGWTWAEAQEFFKKNFNIALQFEGTNGPATLVYFETSDELAKGFKQHVYPALTRWVGRCEVTS
jgi:hypothetical protein